MPFTYKKGIKYIEHYNYPLAIKAFCIYTLYNNCGCPFDRCYASDVMAKAIL